MLSYFITITRRGGLTSAHLDSLVGYFEHRFEKVVVNVEAHKTGLLHLHAFAESTLKSPGAVRKHIVRHLETIGIEVGPKTCVVKAADNGARSYVIKEVTDDKPVTVCKGWSIASLLEERQRSLKKMTIKQAKGSDKVLSQDEVVPMILQFSQSSQDPIHDKESFKDCIKSMVAMGFSFSRVKMAVTYAEVMCRCNDDRALDDWLEMQLTGMR